MTTIGIPSVKRNEHNDSARAKRVVARGKYTTNDYRDSFVTVDGEPKIGRAATATFKTVSVPAANPVLLFSANASRKVGVMVGNPSGSVAYATTSLLGSTAQIPVPSGQAKWLYTTSVVWVQSSSPPTTLSGLEA